MPTPPRARPGTRPRRPLRDFPGWRFPPGFSLPCEATHDEFSKSHILLAFFPRRERLLPRLRMESWSKKAKGIDADGRRQPRANPRRSLRRLEHAVPAVLLSVSKSHLCDVEKGRKTVSPEQAARWARILGYPESVLVRLAIQGTLDAAGL